MIADFEAVLVRSFATPATPCASTTQATDSAGLQAGFSAESISKPVICKLMPAPSMRGMPSSVVPGVSSNAKIQLFKMYSILADHAFAQILVKIPIKPEATRCLYCGSMSSSTLKPMW